MSPHISCEDSYQAHYEPLKASKMHLINNNPQNNIKPSEQSNRSNNNSFSNINIFLWDAPTNEILNERCGDITAIFTCSECETHFPVHYSCYRLECPVCYESAATRIGKRGSATLRSSHKAITRELEPEHAQTVYGQKLPEATLNGNYQKIRIKIYNTLNSGGLRHTILSIPPSDQNRWGYITSQKMSEEVRDHIAKYAPKIIGGLFIFHPFRIRPEIKKRLQEFERKNKDKKEIRKNLIDENKNIDNIIIRGTYKYWKAIYDNVLNLKSKEEYYYFSPHIHMLAWGTLPDYNTYHKITNGWVYKHANKAKPISMRIEETNGKGLNDELNATITYLATHAGIQKTKTGKCHDVIHYFGITSPSCRRLVKDELLKTKIVERVYNAYLDCPKCGPGKHLTLCCPETGIPITNSGQHIHARDKLVVYRSELTEKGKQRLHNLLDSYNDNINWLVSRKQTAVEGIIQVPDPPPNR